MRDNGTLSAVIDLVLPRVCAGCGAPAASLCSACRPSRPTFVVDGSELSVVSDVVPDIRAAAAYDAGMRRAVIAYKERGRRDLTRPLGVLLGGAVRALDPPPGTVLVAPPTSRVVAAERGGDHVLRLARVASRAAPPGTATVPRAAVLRATRAVRDSAGLGIAARERNLAGSMRALAPPPGAAVAVVVDDVVTTGATLREAARALRAAGWQVHGAAVVAATPRRGGTPLRRFTDDPLAAPGYSV